jgi:uncharacterized protein YyaL (SSP411 family)
LALSLLRLGALDPEKKWIQTAEKFLSSHRQDLEHHPTAFTQLALALDFYWSDREEWAIALGKDEEENDAVVDGVLKAFHPYRVVSRGQTLAKNQDKAAIGGKATLYVCRNFACESPDVGIAAILKRLK